MKNVSVTIPANFKVSVSASAPRDVLDDVALVRDDQAPEDAVQRVAVGLLLHRLVGREVDVVLELHQRA